MTEDIKPAAKTHKRVRNQVAMSGKTPEVVIAAIAKAAQGLTNPKIDVDSSYYGASHYVAGWVPKTEEDYERERKAKEAEQKAKAKAKADRAARDAKFAAQRTVEAKKQEKDAIDALVSALRDAGYDIKKAPKAASVKPTTAKKEAKA